MTSAMRVYVVNDTGTQTTAKPTKVPSRRHIFGVPTVRVGSDTSLDHLEPADACVVVCGESLHDGMRGMLGRVASLTRKCCVVLDCAYSNVFRMFNLRDVWDVWDHVVLVGESNDGGRTLPIYYMGMTTALEKDRSVRVLNALFPNTHTHECAHLFTHHLFACGSSVAALLPPSDVSMALQDIHTMRTLVHERATLCMSPRRRRVKRHEMWAYCHMLWQFRKTQMASIVTQTPILWDILLFFYCICRTFSLPCNHLGVHVHHGELKGLHSMMTDRAYIMRVDTICECLHWLHSNRSTSVSCVIPMVCARTIHIQGHWIYALQPHTYTENVQIVDARRNEWNDKPIPMRFLAYDDRGRKSIQSLFPSALNKGVECVDTIDVAFQKACEEKRPGVVVVSGIGVLSDLSAAMYTKYTDTEWFRTRYAPADGVFLRMDPI